MRQSKRSPPILRAVVACSVLVAGTALPLSGPAHGLDDPPSQPQSAGSSPPPTVAAPSGSPGASVPISGMTFTLSEPVHFLNPEGKDVVAPADTYRIELLSETRLKLVPNAHDPLLLLATDMRHQQRVKEPTTLLIQEPRGLYHLVILLPRGQGFDIAGSSAGIRTPDERIRHVSTVQIEEALRVTGLAEAANTATHQRESMQLDLQLEHAMDHQTAREEALNKLRKRKQESREPSAPTSP